MLWIDITNAPHVRLFRGLIKKHAGDVLVTTRRFSNLEAMLEGEGIEFTTVGSHGGSSKESKLLESAKRVADLAKLVSQEGVEAAIAKHSVELPRVAYGLGIPVLQIVDNEHAENQNRLFLPLCSRIIIPESLDPKALLAQGAEAGRVRTFHGLCEYEHVRDFDPDESAVDDFGPENYVVVRPSAQYASYFKSTDRTEEVVNELTESGHEVVAIPRGSERYENAINVQKADALSLIYFAKAMVGGGGTMNREGALLGTPTISYYPHALLGVDKFLMEENLMHHCKEVADVIRTVERIGGQKDGVREKSREIRASMQSPITVVEEELNSL